MTGTEVGGSLSSPWSIHKPASSCSISTVHGWRKSALYGHWSSTVFSDPIPCSYPGQVRSWSWLTRGVWEWGETHWPVPSHSMLLRCRGELGPGSGVFHLHWHLESFICLLTCFKHTGLVVLNCHTETNFDGNKGRPLLPMNDQKSYPGGRKKITPKAGLQRLY